MLKEDLLFIYFFLSICFIDIVFRLSTINTFSYTDIVISFYFLAAYMVAIYLICSFFQGTARLLLSSFLFIAVIFIYVSQLIYFQFFRTFYSMYSLGKSAQVFEFWKDVVQYLLNHLIVAILLLFPIIIFIVFGKKMFPLNKISWVKRGVFIFLFFLCYLAGIVSVYASGDEQNTAYDLYFNNSSTLLSVEHLGLLTSMRIDFQRLVTHWSPDVKAPVISEPEPNPIEQQPAEELPEKQQEEKVVEYNVLDIDFSKLISEENDQAIQDMHKYFANIQPTKKNDYTGKFKGYNLILLTAEGFSPAAIDKNVTPTLYKLANEGYQFTNFYTPIWQVSTSDGEYVALQGLIPKSGVWSFQESSKNHLPFVLGNQLQKRNYSTRAYHNHTYTYYGRNTSHPNLGYDYKALGKGLNVKETWPESDLEMMEKTVPEYIADEPFHTYYMTVSGHMQYSFTGNYMSWKNKKFVEDLPYSDQAKAYLAAQLELDRALEHLLAELEKAGIAERTLIALSADHYPYGLDDQTIDELAGHPVERNFELYKNTFILYTKGIKPEVITKPASSLDILPTLSNLLGLDYDSRLLMGKDIFSDADPLVLFLNKSFITDKGMYNAETRTFTANTGEQIDKDYIKYISSIVEAKFYYSTEILETDYYRKIE
ncbi:LTA synthase family protein [Lederbergia panacisoli]|uniref:LTA synthase family protein n=1 Tax=Lederbergia panacisoli TaxID=1255251 RepID=UPI00214C3518|nr:alkaline phosphatase family protein [Lederbergia panacisoli]MCR2822498.1 sulfatase-like hydrolase/transferase [Lederbergia panacisoli]